MNTETVTRWMRACAASISEQRDYLTQLDAAIGDADHGANMTRGFNAVEAKLDGLDSDTPPGKALMQAGSTLVSTVGGASGPLWGSALRRAGKALGDADTFAPADLVAALEAALNGIVELGAAEPGDKTIVDALGPAVSTLRAGVEAGRPLDGRRLRRAGGGRGGHAGDDPHAGAQGTGVIPGRALRRPPGSRRHIDGTDHGCTRTHGGGGIVTPQVMRGTPASPGAAIGPAWTRSETVPAAGAGPPEAEAQRARRGLELAADELGELARTLTREGHAGDAEIVEANQLMAQDPTLLEAAVNEALAGATAPEAIARAIEPHAQALAAARRPAARRPGGRPACDRAPGGRSQHGQLERAAAGRGRDRRRPRAGRGGGVERQPRGDRARGGRHDRPRRDRRPLARHPARHRRRAGRARRGPRRRDRRRRRPGHGVDRARLRHPRRGCATGPSGWPSRPTATAASGASRPAPPTAARSACSRTPAPLPR